MEENFLPSPLLAPSRCSSRQCVQLLEWHGVAFVTRCLCFFLNRPLASEPVRAEDATEAFDTGIGVDVQNVGWNPLCVWDEADSVPL